MQAPTVAKSCIIPVCGNTKFNLVHKFPADRERCALWIEKIPKIAKISSLSHEDIRKRFFVCARHFKLPDYKHSTSRSLNVTAVPSLNLTSLDSILDSKAALLENNAEVSEDKVEHVKPTTSKPSVPVRILNSGSAKINLTEEAPLFHNITLPDVDISDVEQIKLEVDSFPTPKRIKLDAEITKTDVPLKAPVQKAKPLLESKAKNQPKSPKTVLVKRKISPRKQPPPIEPEPAAEPSTAPQKILKGLFPEEENPVDPPKPVNKLLALFEVTSEQYEKLNKSLSERNEHIESLLNFIDKPDLDPESADNEIVVKIEDGTELKLDLLWLRDHCRCELCYDQSNHQRKISILDIPDDISTDSYAVEGVELLVIWKDKHESHYDLKFLVENQPDKPSKTQEISLWDQEKYESHSESTNVSMRDYMSDPEVSKKVLESLHRYGIAFINGVQPTQQNTEFVIRQLFPIHKTLFGEMWTFSDAKDHSDTAYTNIYLGPHNDNTYFNDAAGLQILHCIQHTSGAGGENLLIDGFQVATKIKEEHPEVFARLTKTIVTGEYVEDGHHHKYSSPIINLDPISGEILQIRFNLYDRAPFKTVTACKIRQFYSDLKVLTREFENPENRITFKLNPGTVLIFDNWRVLHGRMSYTGKRTMTGCYVSRTEFESALRVNKFIE